MFDNYYLHDTDDAGPVKYYGYTDEHGNWLIVKQDTSTIPKTNRFAYGKTNYVTNLANRASLIYLTLAEVLKSISG